MMTILEHATLAHLRACKNRDCLHLALTRAARPHVDPTLHRDLQRARSANIAVIRQLHHVLHTLGRTAGPTQP